MQNITGYISVKNKGKIEEAIFYSLRGLLGDTKNNERGTVQGNLKTPMDTISMTASLFKGSVADLDDFLTFGSGRSAARQFEIN